MSYNTGPKIVTDGLVLCLDAADRNSYPGSGSTWYDLSGNANNGTLTNGPTFSSTNGGSIVFDGSNDYSTFYAPNLGTITTVEMWVKLGAAYSNKMFFGWFTYDVWCQSGRIGYNTANSDLYGISSSTVTDLGIVGSFAHYIFEMNSGIHYSNNKIYINTNQQSLSQLSGGENAGNRNFNNGNGLISGWLYDSNYKIPMSCAVFKVYNRALSADEVRRNYNATKGRFGL